MLRAAILNASSPVRAYAVHLPLAALGLLQFLLRAASIIDSNSHILTGLPAVRLIMVKLTDIMSS